MKCEFCKNEVSEKGFRCFLKRPFYTSFLTGTSHIPGEIEFQIRICDKCLKRKGVNLHSKRETKIKRNKPKTIR